MGRWCHGLVAIAALVGGCASPAPPSEALQGLQDAGDGQDLAGLGGDVSDLAGLGGSGCTDGATCSTGNPGTCGAGHIVCSGGVASCVPDATTQSCYTGAANTMGVGACKAGVQTCVGSLGSCDGQVLPAAQENCFNDIDDDCDGVVNNGCPTALSTGTPRLLTAIGDSGSGTSFSLRCATGTFVSKMVMYGDNNVAALTSLDIYCGKPTLVRGTSSYTVTVAVSGTAQSIGTDRSGPMTTFTCDAASFSPGWQAPGTGVNGSSGGIDGLGLNCGSTTLALDATNHVSFNMTKVAATSSTGKNPDGYLQTTAFEDDCNPGEVLIGYDGKLGSWITYFQPVCAPLQVTYK